MSYTMQNLFENKKPTNILHIKVITKAKFEKIKKEITEDGSIFYKVYVAEAPENGKANKAIINLLAKALGIPKSSLKIISGLTSSKKILKINDKN